MSVLKKALKEERQRLKAMLMTYKKEIATLPKGTIQYKNINGKVYPYLTYRDIGANGEKKVRTVYIKKQDLDQVLRKLEKRKKILQYIKDIEEDLDIIRKAGIEEADDLKAYEEAMADHRKNPRTYTLDEVEKELGLKQFKNRTYNPK